MNTGFSRGFFKSNRSKTQFFKSQFQNKFATNFVFANSNSIGAKGYFTNNLLLQKINLINQSKNLIKKITSAPSDHTLNCLGLNNEQSNEALAKLSSNINSMDLISIMSLMNFLRLNKCKYFS